MHFYDAKEISLTEIQKAKHLGSLKEESNRTKVELILTEVRIQNSFLPLTTPM